MKNTNKYAKESVMMKFNEKMMKKRLHAIEHKDDDAESIDSKDDENKHVNWAIELEEVIKIEGCLVHISGSRK